MITLTQDLDGFIRMSRRFPESATISVAFVDGSTAIVTGDRVNAIFDRAQAAFRANNSLDAKGFSRAPAKTVQPKNKIEFVPVTPEMF